MHVDDDYSIPTNVSSSNRDALLISHICYNDIEFEGDSFSYVPHGVIIFIKLETSNLNDHIRNPNDDEIHMVNCAPKTTINEVDKVNLYSGMVLPPR